MADIAGTYSNHSSYPWADYTVSYSQTGRNASSVSYRVTVAYNITHDSGYGYGYDIYVSYSIGGQSGSIKIKDTWGALSGSASFNITCSTNASGGTLYAKLYSWSSNDSTHSQQAFNTGDRTINKSTFNTAPYWGSGAVINISPSGTIAENTTQLTVSWTGASDNETTSGMKYKVDRYINGNFSATIANNHTSTSVVDNIGGGNSGASYTYRVTPTDNYGVTGGTLSNSQKATKNVLSISGISGNPWIGYDTESFTFNVSGGSNSMGGGSIYRKITSPNITIYNGSVLAGTVTVKVYKSGTTPSVPYIKFSDLVNLYKNATNQSGGFTIILTTSNDYGSSGANSINALVDLRTNPNPPSNIRVSGTVAVRGTNYFIPSKQMLTVTWNNGSDKVNGAALTYEIQGSTSASGGFKTLASNIRSGSGSTSQAVTIPESYYNGGGNYYFKIIGYNAYSSSSSSVSGVITVHKYSPPTISFGVPKRSTSQVQIQITTSLNTSLPSTTFLSGKRNYSMVVKGTSTSVKPSTALTASPQTVTITGLEGAKQYTLTVVANDNTGLSGDISVPITIDKYIPIVSIRDKGLGVNAYADDTYKVKVGGGAYIDGIFGQFAGNVGSGMDFNNILTEGEYSVGAEGDISNAPFSGSIYGKLIVKVNDGGRHNGSNNWIWQIFYRTTNTQVWRRSKTNNMGWTNWVLEYTSGDKPSWGDLSVMGCFFDTAESNYYGLRPRNNSVDEWIRTTKLGFLPFSSNGAAGHGQGSLGSEAWRFENVYAKYGNFNGSVNTDKVFARGVSLDIYATNNSPHYENNFTVYKGQPGSGVMRFRVDDSNVTSYRDFRTDRLRGGTGGDNFYIGAGNFRMENTSNSHARLYTSPVGASDTGLYLDPGGYWGFKLNGVYKHQFNSNGTKSGGSIEIEGMTYGMSPIDSPMIMIEDFMLDVEVLENGTTINLNPIFAKSISGYGVFTSNGKVEIVSKGKESFIVRGYTGKIDVRIVGERIDVKGKYYELMGGIRHGSEEEATY